MLLSFCLIRLGSSDGLYTVHPLIHAWGKDRMSLDERKKYGTMTYATLSDSLYGKFERQPYEFRRALVTHVRENMQYRRIESQEAGDSYFDDAYERFGLLLLEQGYPSEASKLEEQVLDLRSNVLGKDHHHTMMATARLASTYIDLGKYTNAEKLHLHVLHVSKRLFGPEHKNTIHTMGNISVAYLHQGKYKEACEMQIKVVDAMRSTLEEEDPHLLKAMSNLTQI